MIYFTTNDEITRFRAGKPCVFPMHDDAWKIDETLEVTHPNLNQEEKLVGLKLCGIVSSSLLFTGIMVTRLGTL